MKGISLVLGKEVKTKKCQPSKMAKMSAKNEENKKAKVNVKHEEGKMATEPRARYKLHRCSQSEKVEGKGVKLPHLRKPRDKGTGHQRKDETPKNNGNKFPNTYREDKRKITNLGQNESQQIFALCDRMDKEGDILDWDSSPNESPDRVKEGERGRMIGQNPKNGSSFFRQWK